MKVKVEYPVTRHIEIEIPDELANKYKDAHAEENDDKIDSAVDKIDDYVRDTLPQIDADAEFLDWWDWEIID
jgi:hypothetical protein